MPDERIDFRAGTTIALIVRGKTGPDHHPGKLEQHADAVLADGAPIGFFGEGNDAFGNSVGMSMTGIVYDYAAFRINRPFYVDLNAAVADRVLSTVLLLTVDAATAARFRAAWDDMAARPGGFDLLGNNCATHASRALRAAGVIDAGIPGLDTPDNLYRQLADSVPAARRRSLSGFIGFLPLAGGGYTLTVRVQAPSPNVNVPNPGRSGSLRTTSRGK